MTLNMTADSLKNGLSTVTTRLPEHSVPYRARGCGAMSLVAVTGALFSLRLMNQTEMSTQAAGTMSKKSIASSRELIYSSMRRIPASLLSALLKLIRSAYSLTVKFVTTSS